MRRVACWMALAVLVGACGLPEPTSDAAAPVATVAPDCADLDTVAAVDGPLSDDPDIAAAQQARADMGLASDEDTVRALVDAGDGTGVGLGFPHSEEELRELFARNEAAADVEELQRWAQTHAADAYAGLWLDHRAGGALTMAFTRDVAEHRRAIHERFSADIRVVAVEHSLTALEQVEQQVSADLRAQAGDATEEQRLFPPPGTLTTVGIDVLRNRVGVGVVAGDEAALADLSVRYGAERICLERHDPPPDLDPAGPVVPLAKADGWRDDLDIDAYHALIEIAYERDTAERAWTDNVPAELPQRAGLPARVGVYATLNEVDFARQAVVVWTAGQSGSCPQWLADLRTRADGTVRLDTAAAGGGVCTDDYNPYRMLLAVDRDRLPDPAALPTTSGEDIPDALVRAYPPQPQP